MKYTNEFTQWLISHYSERLTTEQKKGNIAAASFLRATLFNLKNQQ